MSKVTLESLREDFEQAKVDAAKVMLEHRPKFGKTRSTMAIIHRLLGMIPAEVLADDKFLWITDRMRRSAKVYDIASDKGLEAAMLWKLAHWGDA